MSRSVANADNIARWWGVDPEARIAAAREGLSAAAWRFDADTPFELVSDPDPDTHILSPVLSGEADCELFLDDRRRYRTPIHAGMVNLIRAGERPRAVEYGATCTFLHLYLPDVALQRYAEDTPGAPPVELRPIEAIVDRTVHRIAHEIYVEMRRGGVASRLIVDGLTLQLAGHLVRHWSNLAGADNAARGGLAPWQLKRTCEAMTARLDADLGLDDLAQIAGCSATHFSRAFKQSMGLAPFHWLAEQRIERAKELLATSGLSLAEIALSVGYSAQPQFTSAFGRATGITPGQWRRERLS